MYALQTVGSTTSSVKDDTEVLDLEDGGNSIAEHILHNSNAIKRSGNMLSANDYQSSLSHPVVHDYDQGIDGRNESVGLCFWMIFQATGITCIATIVYQCITFKDGFFVKYSHSEPMSISKNQFSDWHYSLTTIGFIYLYANTIFLIRNKKVNITLPYIMLHTFAYVVSVLGLYAMYVHKDMSKHKDCNFYETHLYSIHSWTGLFATMLFTIQWLSAIFVFTMPCMKALLGVPLGKMFSLYTALVSSIALIAGINQPEVDSSKEEKQNYSIDLLILNSFGLLVMFFLFLIAYVVIKPYRK